jgi:hypothetical protein
MSLHAGKRRLLRQAYNPAQSIRDPSRRVVLRGWLFYR